MEIAKKKKIPKKIRKKTCAVNATSPSLRDVGSTSAPPVGRFEYNMHNIRGIHAKTQDASIVMVHWPFIAWTARSGAISRVWLASSSGSRPATPEREKN
jgi:hypothetical protein